MTDRRAGAVLFTADMERLTAFYEAVTELERISGADDHDVLAGAGFTLVIHQIPEPLAGSVGAAVRPVAREGSAVKLCLPAADLGLARERAEPLGGQVYGAEYTWTWGDLLVCDGQDPDGNVFQLWQAIPD